MSSSLLEKSVSVDEKYISLSFRVNEEFNIITKDNENGVIKVIDIETFENKMIKIFNRKCCIEIRKGFLLSFFKTELIIEKKNGKYSYYYEVL